MNGTASDLLGALAEAAGERAAKSKTWPDSPRALAGRLRRAAAFLRKIGIEISFGREGRARTRTITIVSETDWVGKFASASSASSASKPKSNYINGLAADGSADCRALDADGTGASTVRANPLKLNDADDADGRDANFPTQSAPEKQGDDDWEGGL